MISIIRSTHADLRLGDKIVDCYMLPDREKRIGLTGADTAIGQKNYLSKLLVSDGKALKSLKRLGFSGDIKEVEIRLESGTVVKSKTISIRDFVKLITWDAIVNKNQDSIVLLASFAEASLDDTLGQLFNYKSLDDLPSKIVHYTKWKIRNWQDALDEIRK